MRHLVIFLALTWCTSHALAATPSVADVTASVAAKGAKHTIDELVRTDQWDAALMAMTNGASSWIALAPKLAQGSDASTSEGLGMSLAFALPINASAVLAALDPGNGIVLGSKRVCGRPFIENIEPAGYKRRTLAALNRVSDPRLTAAKLKCIAVLRATRF